MIALIDWLEKKMAKRPKPRRKKAAKRSFLSSVFVIIGLLIIGFSITLALLLLEPSPRYTPPNVAVFRECALTVGRHAKVVNPRLWTEELAGRVWEECLTETP